MSIKLLVADDSITIQKVISIIFGGDDYSLTVVDNGKTALEKAREIDPDVLLIDALMPGMSGYEVSEAIRATPSLATKPILILTGSFEPFDEDRAKRCGADDFLAKPFESQQIVAKVREMAELGAARAQDASAAVEFSEADTAVPVLSVSQEPVPASLSSNKSFTVPPLTQAEAAEQTPAPSDIWGAFTPQVESAAAPEETSFEAPVVSSTQQIGSQWIPVEENTFEFKEEVVENIQPAPYSAPVVAAQVAAFGDIAFVNETFSPNVSETTPAAVSVSTAPRQDAIFGATPVEAPESSTAGTATAQAAGEPAPLTEERLKAAIAAVSRDVVERIVWEVVPDLAETLIREAIRKIKEGR